ncbi:hypothetical protein [Paenibacillus wenxiniae]|uniref:Uncharacterized protein n=1 Tax=Paenibacillus wenxiniae TaxID=1636843 RepID=A0ABW4RQT1_9BACL
MNYTSMPNSTLTHTSPQPIQQHKHDAGTDERITCFFYTWTPEGTSMEQTTEWDEPISMSVEEQQRQIEEELEYLNSWDRVLEWL